MDDRERPLPYGFLTDDAEELICAIERCAMSAKAKYFMTRVVTRALRHSGFERSAGNPEPGLWCGFDTATWAAENGWTKQYTSYIREQLVGFNLLSWHPIEPGRGKLRVNPDRATWAPLQPGAHTKRYAKPGAGRPRKQTAERNEPEKITRRASVTNQISDSQTALPGTGVEPIAIRNKSASLRLVDKDENYSASLRLPASPEISFVTDACSEASAGQAPELPKKSTEEETYTDTIVSGADAPSPLLVAETSAPSSEFLWPPRQEHEKSDLDYYQRVIREREKERVALLARLAHEKLNIPLQGSYGRIGALAKKCGGAGLLVKRILDAAASHIDGDPFDYLTKMVNGQKPAKALASNGSMPATHASTEDDRAALAASRASKQQGQAQKQRPSYLR